MDEHPSFGRCRRLDSLSSLIIRKHARPWAIALLALACIGLCLTPTYHLAALVPTLAMAAGAMFVGHGTRLNIRQIASMVLVGAALGALAVINLKLAVTVGFLVVGVLVLSLVISEHRALYVLFCLIPFSYVPFQVTHHYIDLSYVSFGFVLYLGLAYRVYYPRLDRIESAALLLMAFIILRLGGSVAESGGSAALYDLAREVLTILAGLILWRIAKKPGIMPAIFNGLAIATLLMVGLEFLQHHEGLPHLMALGYVTPKFNYYTAIGQMRPFGPFLSPTVFGAYLAMVLSFLMWTRYPGQSRASVVFSQVVVAAGIGGLVATQTRAAWISLAMSYAITLLWQPKSRAARIWLMSFPLGLLVASYVIAHPAIFTHYTNRFDTLFNLSFTSNHDRLELWGGTIRAVFAKTPIAGYGEASFATVLSQYIPAYIADLGHPHNVYLEFLYQFGLIGMVMYLVMLWRIFQRVKATAFAGAKHMIFAGGALAAVVCFSINSMFELLWTSYSFVVTVFLIAGAGLAAASLNPGQGEAGDEPIQ